MPKKASLKPAETMPPAWRVSADTVAGATFDKYRSRLIHENATIQEFLSDTSAERFIISAPKGFGKTLLLIAKRLQLNELGNELSDDGGELIDRPADKFPIPSASRMTEFNDGLELWKKIWSYSIMVAAIKKHDRIITSMNQHESGKLDSELEAHSGQLDPWTRSLLLHKTMYRSPTVVFTSLLSLDYTDRERALRSVPHLATLVTGVRSQVAFFIDNVDEYFSSILEDHHASESLLRGADNRRRSNDIWINAQLALVSVAHSIQKNHRHIRIYCTIRHEAFLKLKERSEEYAQIQGRTVVISYTRSDLKMMFEKNVALMPAKSLHAGFADAVSKFFGPGSKVLQHRLVDSKEDAFDLVLRHTFYRPRDLMTICHELALLAPEERTPEAVISTVDNMTKRLVWSLHSEMLPFFRLPDLEVLSSCITKNALTTQDLTAVVAAYQKKLEDITGVDVDQWEEDYKHPFCILYEIGLIGWIQTPNKISYEDNQHFVKPDEVEVRRHHGLPPTVNYYLIHPALDYLIFEKVGKAYQTNFHHDSIIGADLPWKEPLDSVFVIKGDLCGFSNVMGTEFYRNIAIRIHEWAKASCGNIDFVEVSNGDSILMIDRSVDNLVEAAFRFLSRARSYQPTPLNFRFGGSAGPIVYEKVPRRLQSNWEEHLLPLGLALRTSARLEPHAEPGTLLVDEAFRKAIRATGGLKVAIKDLAPEHIPTLVYEAERRAFKVQKNVSDPAYYTKLHQVSLSEPRN